MKLCKIVTAFVVLTSLTICSTEIVIRSPERDESTELIVDAMINILVSCYGNEKLGIGVTKTFPEPFLKTLWSRKFIPILLINDTVHMTDPYDIDNLTMQRLNTFVIIASDVEQFMREYYNIELSRWFNRLASFLIVDWSPTAKYGCRDFKLATLFQITIFKRIFNLNILCLHPTKGRMLFSYNPHTDKAPVPWQLTATVNGWQPWKIGSVFEREYRQKDICKNLYFDKINDLGGSSIEFLRFEPIAEFQSPETQPPKLPVAGSRSTNSSRPHRRTLAFDHKWRNIVLTFTHHINGTLKIIRRKNSEPRDITDSLNNMEIFPYIFMTTYPCMQTSVSIATNFAGNKSQLIKIITLIDVYTRVGTCVTLLITLIVLKVINRQRFVPALLNILRITVNTGFTSLLETNALRIYQTGLYLFAITMHGILAGALASLLTRDMPVKHPQTVEDLVDGNYTIYVSFWYINLGRELRKKGRFVMVMPYDQQHSIDYMIDGGPLSACMAPTHELLDRAKVSNIYVSATPVYNKYVSPLSQPYWPYEEKFKEILLRMMAGDIVDTLDMRIARYNSNFFRSDDEGPKVMTLTNLQFAFVNLGIGLGCATLCFIIEITHKPLCSAIAKVRRRLSDYFLRIRSRKLKQQKLKV